MRVAQALRALRPRLSAARPVPAARVPGLGREPEVAMGSAPAPVQGRVQVQAAARVPARVLAQVRQEPAQEQAREQAQEPVEMSVLRQPRSGRPSAAPP
jgi:hypothetical protein